MIAIVEAENVTVGDLGLCSVTVVRRSCGCSTVTARTKRGRRIRLELDAAAQFADLVIALADAVTEGEA